MSPRSVIRQSWKNTFGNHSDIMFVSLLLFGLLFIKRMRMNRVLIMLFFLLLVVLLFTGKWNILKSLEPFGTSPGTMVQLQTSHVPTGEDVDFYTRIYPKMVRREITDMTEGDPGELRPWIFPWYGRGVTLIAS